MFPSSHGDVRSWHACLQPSRGLLASPWAEAHLWQDGGACREEGEPWPPAWAAPTTCCQLSPSVQQQEPWISVPGFRGPNPILAGGLWWWLHHWLSIRASIHQVLCHLTCHDPTDGDGEPPDPPWPYKWWWGAAPRETHSRRMGRVYWYP